jgi:signal transduction histidine kinase
VREADLYPQHRFAFEGTALRPVASDARLLGIVVSNLLSNAAKYSPAHTQVTLSCSQNADGTTVRVTDEGPGIPSYLRDSMFAAGVRAADDHRGHGLGLYVARKLCDSIGAKLEVESEVEGKGATFVLTLPAGLEGETWH